MLVLLACCVTLAGCGPKEAPRGDISGSVSYQGKLIETGCISLYSPTNGLGSSGDVQSDGSFSLKGIPVGSYQVSVMPPQPVPPAPGETPKPQAKFPLPAKYAESTSSGLTFDVKKGANELKLDLK